jgi:hypothetical protein
MSGRAARQGRGHPASIGPPSEGVNLLKRLLGKGLNPNDPDHGGYSMIQNLFIGMDFEFYVYSSRQGTGRPMLDTPRTRDKMKAIHLLAKHGGK